MAAAIASLQLVELEQSILRELLRVAEANGTGDLMPADFEAASTGLRASLRRHSEQVDALEQIAVVQDRLVEEEEVRAHVRRHRAEAVTLAASLRELAAKVRSDRSQREASERAALFAPAAGAADSSEGGASSRSGGYTARQSAQTARDVTESLRRTRALMANELQRTEASLRSLDDQGKKLKTTLNEHRGIDGTLASGRRKLNRLDTRDTTDKVLFALAFGFFCCVVLHIVHKRLGALPQRAAPEASHPHVDGCRRPQIHRPRFLRPPLAHASERHGDAQSDGHHRGGSRRRGRWRRRWQQRQQRGHRWWRRQRRRQQLRRWRRRGLSFHGLRVIRRAGRGSGDAGGRRGRCRCGRGDGAIRV